MNKWSVLVLFIISILSSACFAANKAVILDLQGPIGPATQDYVQRGITQAVADKAAIVILEINTPGGLETSMRGITEAIIQSTIPIIAYVAPSGARAASAGTFIVLASHFAYMAPGTNIGAASPVAIGSPTEQTDQKISTHEKKAMNDAAAYIRGLAQLRNRNIEWAEKAVRESASVSALDAKKLNVINDIAEDYPDLLKKISESTQIETKGMVLDKKQPDWRYEFLSFLTNPNIAYILMLVAIYGIFFELSNPGLILPGVAGLISLLLVLYAFQLMPINYAGLFLILTGILFVILELYVPSFGILGIGGFIAFVLGSVMLFDVQGMEYGVAWPIIITMSVISGAFLFIILNLAIQSHRKKVVSGREGLIGKEGTVLNVSETDTTVFVFGEAWKVRSTSPLHLNQKVKVIDVKGLELIVEPLDKEESSKK